jgi:hypothetical protein
MSLALLCEKHTVTVKSQTSTKTAGGAAQKAWTSNSRTVKCNQQGTPSSEIAALGIRAGKRSWKLFTSSDPEIGSTSHVWVVPYTGADAVETSVVQPSRPQVLGSGSVMAWVTVIEEFGPVG